MKAHKKISAYAAFLAGGCLLFGLLIGGFAGKHWGSKESSVASDWSIYTDSEGKYALEYPSFLTPVTTESGVDFSDDSTFDGFSLSEDATTTKAEDTSMWISLQSQYMNPLFSVRNTQGQEFVVVESQIQVDAHADGTPIFATQLSAIQVYEGVVYKITWQNEAISENGDLPNVEESLVHILQNFVLTSPQLSSDDQAWHDANATLAQFLGLLHEGTYAAAAQNFGGDITQLQEWNPVGSTDDARLWEMGCEQNGLQCLAVKSITPVETKADGTRVFSVVYETEAGEEYSQQGKSAFLFEVKKGKDGLYLVQTLPPYQE